MNLSYQALLSRVASLNRRTHVEADFKRICERINCEFVFRKQNKNGYFVADECGDYIFIDSRIRGLTRLDVLFHELTHAILHHPCAFLDFRQQKQAQIFALIFMIPKRKLFECMKLSFDEIDYRLLPYLKRRLRVFEIWEI